MHWTLATGATLISGLILLAAVFVQGLGGKDRFWAGVGGASFTVYGLWGINRTSGIFYYNWIVFVVPVAAIIYLSYRAFGSSKKPDPAPVARPLLPAPTGGVPRVAQNAVPVPSWIPGGPMLPSPGPTFGGVASPHPGPSTPATIARAGAANPTDMTASRSPVVAEQATPVDPNLADMTVVRSGLVAATALPVGPNLADMTVVRSRLIEAPEVPSGAMPDVAVAEMADAGVADLTVARSRLVGTPVRPWGSDPVDGVADKTLPPSPLITAADHPVEQVSRESATADETCSVCGHPLNGGAVRCARCGAPLTV